MSDDNWTRDIFFEAARPYPPVLAFVEEVWPAIVGMRAETDPRWRPIAQLLEDEVDIFLSDDLFQPLRQVSTDWIERNKRGLLDIVRTYVEESAGEAN